MFLASTLVALALAAGPDTAQATASTAETKPAAEAKAKAKKVCYESKVSGSRLSRKTCVTTAPSKAEKDAAREEAEAAEAKPGA